jgi:hypothetical protein
MQEGNKMNLWKKSNSKKPIRNYSALFRISVLALILLGPIAIYQSISNNRESSPNELSFTNSDGGGLKIEILK